MLGKLFSSSKNGQDPAPQDEPTLSKSPNSQASSPTSTNALNQSIVQAVTFSNQTTEASAPSNLVQVPVETMASQSAGHAVQNAVAYMNGIMQIALAAQTVIAKRDVEDPANTTVDAPVLAALQAMVTAAVTNYGTVSTTAGTSVQTIVSDVGG